MSYIVRSGKLIGVPDLRYGEGGAYAYVGVVVNDRARQGDGSYKDTGSIRYNLTVRGSTAERLVALAERSGNIRIVFGGRYRVREFERADGTLTLSHDVRVDELGISLIGQTLTIQPGPTPDETDDTTDDQF